MMDQLISIPIEVAEEALRWLETLADVSDDLNLEATIVALRIRIDAWRLLERISIT